MRGRWFSAGSSTRTLPSIKVRQSQNVHQNARLLLSLGSRASLLPRRLSPEKGGNNISPSPCVRARTPERSPRPFPWQHENIILVNPGVAPPSIFFLLLLFGGCLVAERERARRLKLPTLTGQQYSGALRCYENALRPPQLPVERLRTCQNLTSGLMGFSRTGSEHYRRCVGTEQDTGCILISHLFPVKWLRCEECSLQGKYQEPLMFTVLKAEK